MTGKELYELGIENPQIKCLVPDGLTPCLPRLELMDHRLVLQFWYFRVDVTSPENSYYPLLYAELDASTRRLTAFRALTKGNEFCRSFPELWPVDGFDQELAYLDHCAALVAKGRPTQREITESQAMWLDAQCAELTAWAQLMSGIRTEAVHMLLAPNPESTTRNLASLWRNELVYSGFIQGELLSRGLTSEINDYEELCCGVYRLFGKDRHIFKKLLDMQPRCASRF